MRHVIELRDPLLVKGYGFLSSARNMDDNIDKIVNGRYG